MIKTLIAIPTAALLVAGCSVPRETMNKLELGMTRDEVVSVMGEPESTSADAQRGECLHYSLWRDFWNRRPGDYADRYYVCFKEGEVISYGRNNDKVS